MTNFERILVIFGEIIIAMVLIAIGLFAIEDIKLTKFTTENVVVEVQDKHTENVSYPMMVGKVMTIQHRTEYYLDTDEADIEVSHRVYNEYEAGQKITVTRTDKYKVKDGEEFYVGTTYEWK